MKLLVFFPSVEYGGCEEYAMGMAKHISSCEWQVEVCFPQLTTTKLLTDFFNENNILVHSWHVKTHPSTEWGEWESQKNEAIKHLQIIKPNAVLIVLPAPDSALGFIAACAELQVRGLVVFQLANEYVYIPEQHLIYCKKAYYQGLKWVATSNYMIPYLKSSFPFLKEDIEIIPNGRILKINTDSKPSSIFKNNLRNSLGLPKKAKIILTLARLTPQKGHKDIITIAAELISLFPDVYFVFAGAGEDFELLSNIIHRKGLEKHIFLLGFQSNVDELLQGSDIFLLPSHWESTPLSITEAMFYKCPVVVSNAGGNEELVANKKTGIVFQAGNTKILLTTLVDVLNNLDRMKTMLNLAKKTAKTRTEFMKNRVVDLLNQSTQNLTLKKHMSELS